MITKEYEIKRIIQGSLSKGDDIIQSLQEILKQKDTKTGIISAIGAVSEAKIGFFNATTKRYEERLIKEQMEVLSLLGNVSIKDNAIFPHLHILLSRQDLSVIGGHLYTGTIVYALEFQIIALSGDELIRDFDDNTGLYIWKR